MQSCSVVDEILPSIIRAAGWLRRSTVRSECAATRTINNTATKFGTIDNTPRRRFDIPVRLLRTLGNHMVTP